MNIDKANNIIEVLKSMDWDKNRIEYIRDIGLNDLYGLSSESVMKILSTFQWDDGKIKCLKLIRDRINYINGDNALKLILSVFQWDKGRVGCVEIIKDKIIGDIDGSVAKCFEWPKNFIEMMKVFEKKISLIPVDNTDGIFINGNKVPDQSISHAQSISHCDIINGSISQVISRDGNEKKKMKFDNDHQLCSICMERDKNILFEPCHHITSCAECSEKLNECPICRTIIDKKIKVFL